MVALDDLWLLLCRVKSKRSKYAYEFVCLCHLALEDLVLSSHCG